jgi:hypothetical protein
VADAAVHIVVPTHTTRHLAATLAGIARQSRAPSTITVSCDTDDDAIGTVIAAWAPRIAPGVWWVRRAFTGGERLCQVRNNAVRHLAEATGFTEGQLVILDGDMVLHREAIARHAALATRAPLILPYRINLDRATTGASGAEAIAQNTALADPTEADLRVLRQRDARSRKHLLLRAVRLGAAHKPKLLGGHFACDLAAYLRLNGFDELYQGWGFKDDEFAYRAARSGIRAFPACAAIPAWHLWHPTRQPDAPMRTLPTAQRFALRARLPLVCDHGVRNPLPQPPVAATFFAGAPNADTMRL